MHLIVCLLKSGHSVGSLDLDGRQATLSHYLHNRERYAASSEDGLLLPEHRRIETSLNKDLARAEQEESSWLAQAIESLLSKDFIVIDTPGSNTFLSRVAHVLADTLVTPLNDSFLDLDVLVKFDLEGKRITGPSIYAMMVLDRWARRVSMGGSALTWIVMRNRLAHLDSRNQRQMCHLLKELAPRLGFHLADGLGERVIFRELFTRGLTLLDQEDRGVAELCNHSHEAARREIWSLVEIMGLGNQPDRLRQSG